MTSEDDNSASDDVPGVAKRSLSTYAGLWQFEPWLRRMVYVELRALRGDDWNADIPKLGNSFHSDKRLIHMPTPEMDALSYAPLSTLKRPSTTTGRCLRHIFHLKIFGKQSWRTSRPFSLDRGQ